MTEKPATFANTRELRPSWTATAFFFLLFSGPPSFRLRDPESSLQGAIDATVVLQVSVWVAAGVWVLYQLHRELRGQSSLTMSLPTKLGIAMVVLLGLSTFVSEAPPLTAFKVGQMFITLLFTSIFVKRYGIAKCLDYIFVGSLALSVAIAICAFVAPDLVLFSTSDGMRLRGDPIAVMGIVGTYSMILLLIKRDGIPRVIFWLLIVVLSVLLAFSLTRQAWFLVVLFYALYFTWRSRARIGRRLGFLFLGALPFLFIFYILPALEEYRSAESVETLTGRTDLWVYLVGVTIARSPWVGLGYFAASRVLGPEFNPGMGTAHSMFVEVFLGGGLVSLIPLLALCLLVSFKAFQLLLKTRIKLEFACGSIFLVTLALGAMGGDIGFGQVGITFWSLVAAIPAMGHCRSISLELSNSRALLKQRYAKGRESLQVDNQPLET